VIGVVVLIALIGVLLPTDVWRVAFGGDEESADVLFEDDFSTPRGWNFEEDSLARLAYDQGGLRMTIKQPRIAFARTHPFDRDVGAISVEVDATELAGGSGIIGVLCARSAQHGEAGRAGGGGAYIATVVPLADHYGLALVDQPLERSTPDLTRWLHEGTITISPGRIRSTRIRADCIGGADKTSVTIFVDGRRLGTGTNPVRLEQFDGVGLFVVHVPKGALPDVRFDNVTARELQP